MTTAERDLQDHIEAGLPRPEVESVDASNAVRFIIKTKAQADWALRKIAQRRKALTEDEALYALERKRLDEWIASRRDSATSETDHFVELLEEFHRSILAEDERAKTISLPSGSLTSRAGQMKWTVTDPEAFIAWAEENALELVRVKKEPALNEIKKALTPKVAEEAIEGVAVSPDGEIVPGVKVEPQPRTFKQEVNQ